MNRENYPIYQQVVGYYLSSNNKKFHKVLASSKLSRWEKKLLTVRKLIWAGEYENAQSLALSCMGAPCPFLKAEASFLSATVSSLLGLWEESMRFNLKAKEFYTRLLDKRGLFLTNYNLSVDASRLGLESLSLDFLEAAENYTESMTDKNLLLRAKACGFSKTGNHKSAVEDIEMALHQANAKQDDFETLNLVAADIYFRAEDIESCEKALDKIKKCRTIRQKPRLYFNISAIKLLKGEKLERVSDKIDDSEEYSLKWNLILSLKSGDIQRSNQLWSDLCKLFPSQFGGDFEIKNKYEKFGIFAKVIEKYRVKNTQSADVQIGDRTKIGQLHKLFLEAPGPIRKEEIIEQIWDSPYDPKQDAKFYKMVQRLKSLSLPLVNESQAYFYKFNGPK